MVGSGRPAFDEIFIYRPGASVRALAGSALEAVDFPHPVLRWLLIAILGRQPLFTENTLTVILLFLLRKEMKVLIRVLRPMRDCYVCASHLLPETRAGHDEAQRQNPECLGRKSHPSPENS
jgi:hypothetical protein